VIALLTTFLPYAPIAGPLGFAPLPLSYLLLLGLIAVLYAATTEVAKRVFYARSEF
jgi:Mg2+-importing ATPase